jgi:sugar lactone lactonase YvrE
MPTTGAKPPQARPVADGFRFLEGPRWHEGRLYASDMLGGEVLAFATDGTVERVCEVPEQPSGLGFTPTGELLVSSMRDRRIWRLRDGALELVADLADRTPFWTNDMLVDEAGRAYVGDFGLADLGAEALAPTRLHRVNPDGTVETAAEGLVFPNGMTRTPDGRTLFVAETFAFRVSAFDVAADGTLTNRRLHAEFRRQPATTLAEALASGAVTPDGIALDAEGALWIGDAAGSGAVRLDADGRIGGRIAIDSLTVFALAFGGEDGRTLFLCAAPRIGEADNAVERNARLFACRVETPGAGFATAGGRGG